MNDNMSPEGLALLQDIQYNLSSNSNKLSFDYVQTVASNSTGTYAQLTPNTRSCVLTLDTGHEVVGYARVLDSGNDDPVIGNKVALENATNELWALLGTLAKLYIGP